MKSARFSHLARSGLFRRRSSHEGGGAGKRASGFAAGSRGAAGGRNSQTGSGASRGRDTLVVAAGDGDGDDDEEWRRNSEDDDSSAAPEDSGESKDSPCSNNTTEVPREAPKGRRSNLSLAIKTRWTKGFLRRRSDRSSASGLTASRARMSSGGGAATGEEPLERMRTCESRQSQDPRASVVRSEKNQLTD